MSMETKIIGLKKKQIAILERLRTAQAQQKKEDRRLEVRRKILIGVATLRAVEKGLVSHEAFFRLLGENLDEKDLTFFKI